MSVSSPRNAWILLDPGQSVAHQESPRLNSPGRMALRLAQLARICFRRGLSAPCHPVISSICRKHPTQMSSSSRVHWLMQGEVMGILQVVKGINLTSPNFNLRLCYLLQLFFGKSRVGWMLSYPRQRVWLANHDAL